MYIETPYSYYSTQNFDVKNSLNEFRVLKMVEKKYVGKFYVYFIE